MTIEMTIEELYTQLETIATNNSWDIIYTPFDNFNREYQGDFPVIIVLPFESITPTNENTSELDFNFDLYPVKLIFAGLAGQPTTNGIDSNAATERAVLSAQHTRAKQFLHALQYDYENSGDWENNTISGLKYYTSHEYLSSHACIGCFVEFDYLTINTIEFC